MKNLISILIEGDCSMNKWAPSDDKLQLTSIWSFPDRGSWATHNGNYPGNWSPYIPRNVIKRYSNKGDVVLDPFLGSGTTLIEAKLLGRKGIGVDINSNAIQIAKDNCCFNYPNMEEIEFIVGDALDLNFIYDNSIDLICTHPPYANIIRYSNGIKGDISLYDIDGFLLSMQQVSKEMFRVLKKGKYCAFLIGDMRKNGRVIPLGFKTLEIFQKSGFVLKEIVIKEQHNCKSTDKWKEKSIQYNFLLLAHEYLFILLK